jgi:hypothetical protein
LIILGVDPGVTGAMAFVDGNHVISIIDHDTWCNAHDAARELYHLLDGFYKPEIVVIEAQHARPARDKNGKVVQGIASTWNYAEHYGILLGVLTQYEVSVHKVNPAVWKANMHLDRDKEKSLNLARKLFPTNAHDMFKLKKHHGRAEAALIAYYGVRFLPLPVKRRVL